jgi:hypothetical protein
LSSNILTLSRPRSTDMSLRVRQHLNFGKAYHLCSQTSFTKATHWPDHLGRVQCIAVLHKLHHRTWVGYRTQARQVRSLFTASTAIFLSVNLLRFLPAREPCLTHNSANCTRAIQSSTVTLPSSAARDPRVCTWVKFARLLVWMHSPSS